MTLYLHHVFREPPILIEPEKAYHHRSTEPHSPFNSSSPPEAMSNRDIVPHENDVLMGRGGKNNQHIGNEKLRTLARVECENYRLASKKGKSYISRELVKKVRAMDPPGRFLKRNQKTGFWEDVGDEVGREKASQVLRDAVSALSDPTPVVTKNVSESVESSEHDEGHHHEHEHESNARMKRQRSESASTLDWPAPPRMLSVGAPSTKQQHHLQPEAYTITPVSPTTKRQRTVYYQQDTYSPDRPPSPSISPYTRHPPEALLDHAQQLPPPPPPLHHYAHHHPNHNQHHHLPPPPQQQQQQHHMQHQQQYQYEYPAPMPPPSRAEYSVPPIPLRPHSGYPPPPRGYPTTAWTGGYAQAPTQAPPADVNEFELFQGELLESDDEGKHPDIQRSDSF